MQSTPSLFMRWNLYEISDRVFSSNSALRILALGGEPFPATSTLSKWKIWQTNPRARIFNLYGLTEMSCWASVYEITENDILNNRQIPIGHPIDEYTQFEVNSDGELLLKSKIRKCYQPQLTDDQVNDDDFEFVLHTGDMVEIGDDFQYCFANRTNSIIKFYGRKINLCEIESMIKTVEGVDDAISVHDEKLNSIVVFVKTEDNSNEIRRRVVKTLQKIGVFVKIHYVSTFPLTLHGKISKKHLLNIESTDNIDKKCKTIYGIVQDLINQSIGTAIEYQPSTESSSAQKRSKTEENSSFIHLGGSSLQAIQIVDELERITTQSIPKLLPMLLNEQISIHEILSHLAINHPRTERYEEKITVENIPRIHPKWKIDMMKCIDATPTVCLLKDNTVVISVGSHSNWLYNVSMTNGEIISKLKLPDRIESQVVQLDDFGIVGCYDGHLYCFDIQTGAIHWKFDAGAMIKCYALIMGAMVIFGNYNESNNLWCLNTNNGTMVWCQRVGTKSIYANPTKFDENSFLVCSLDGTIALVDLNSNILWSFTSMAPIFATPTVFKNIRNEPHILFASVNGMMYNLKSDGTPLWTHQIDGNIFASFESLMSYTDEKCINFAFGSQNNFVYFYEIDEKLNFKEKWKHKCSASIRSTPFFLKIKLIQCVCIFSSDGVLQIFNCDNGKLVKQSKIDGEVFSTPVVYNEHLFVGSRNNYLHCIDFLNFT